jgi:hypothetical protein
MSKGNKHMGKCHQDEVTWEDVASGVTSLRRGDLKDLEEGAKWYQGKAPIWGHFCLVAFRERKRGKSRGANVKLGIGKYQDLVYEKIISTVTLIEEAVGSQPEVGLDGRLPT